MCSIVSSMWKSKEPLTPSTPSVPIMEHVQVHGNKEQMYNTKESYILPPNPMCATAWTRHVRPKNVIITKMHILRAPVNVWGHGRARGNIGNQFYRVTRHKNAQVSRAPDFGKMEMHEMMWPSMCPHMINYM